MELKQVHVVGLQALQRFVELFGGGILSAAIDLSHQEDFLTVAIPERAAHPEFIPAGAFVVVPGVIHEVDTPVDGSADDAGGEIVSGDLSNVRTADADDGYCLPGLTETAVKHVTLAGFGGAGQWIGIGARGSTSKCRAGKGGPEERTSIEIVFVTHTKLLYVRTRCACQLKDIGLVKSI